MQCVGDLALAASACSTHTRSKLALLACSVDQFACAAALAEETIAAVLPALQMACPAATGTNQKVTKQTDLGLLLWAHKGWAESTCLDANPAPIRAAL
eukprot:scaffold22779_cov18-Tisochrysis_lutea.AAC.1